MNNNRTKDIKYTFKNRRTGSSNENLNRNSNRNYLDNYKVSKKDNLIEVIIYSILIAWLLLGFIFNYSFRKESNYLSLEFSGLNNILLFSGLFIVIVALTLRFLKNVRYLLLYISSTLFLGSMYLYPIDGPHIAGIAILSFSTLFLSFREVKRRLLEKNVFLVLAILSFLLNLSLLVFSLMKIPYMKIYGDFINHFTVTNEVFNLGFLISLGISLLLFLYFLITKKEPKERVIFIFALLAFLGQSILVGRVLYFKYASLNTPTYDFNLFAQMFHSMSTYGLPMTTLERNGPLSHFLVHLSPIYYLLLPFYNISKDPGILQILQAVVVASGVFPLYLIGKNFKLNGNIRIGLSLIFLACPAFITSSFYDLHENCFLVPLLFWLFYFVEKKNLIGIAASTLLILGVKEDASIYIWSVALFIIFEKKMIKEGIVMFLTSSTYFIWAMKFLKDGGQGAMLGRFDNMVSIKNFSILSVPFTILRNPGFFLKTIFSQSKIIYVIQTMGAITFTPLLNRKYTRFILLIPYIVINLISDYPYQADIGFQYNYGSMTFLFYMLLLFLKDIKENRENKEIENDEINNGNKNSGKDKVTNKVTNKVGFVASLVLSLGLTVSLLTSGIHLSRFEYFPKYYKENSEKIILLKKYMDKIPKEASVTASPFLTGYLSNRDFLYDLEYNVTDTYYFPSQYMVFDLRPGYTTEVTPVMMQRFISDGYAMSIYVENVICILYKK